MLAEEERGRADYDKQLQEVIEQSDRREVEEQKFKAIAIPVVLVIVVMFAYCAVQR